MIPCNSEFRAYALVRFNLRQIQFTYSSDRSRVRKAIEAAPEVTLFSSDLKSN